MLDSAPYVGSAAPHDHGQVVRALALSPLMSEVETKIKRSHLLKELYSACEQATLTGFITENPTDAGFTENLPYALARLAPLPIEEIPSPTT